MLKWMSIDWKLGHLKLNAALIFNDWCLTVNPIYVLCRHLHGNSCCTGEVFAVACSPTDASLVATGGEDEKGFLWKIGKGDWAFELQGMSMRK